MKISLETICDAVTKWSLRAVFFLTPIFFLPLTPYPVDLNKQFVFMTLTLIATIAWLVKCVKRGKIEYAKNYAGVPLIALVIFVIISAFFSGARSISLMGSTGGEVDTALAVIGFALFYFLISVSFRDKSDIKGAFVALIASGSLAVVYVIAQTLGLAVSFNPVGTMNAFGLYAGFVGVLAFGISQYAPVMRRTRIVTGIIAAVSLILVFLIGYWASFIALILAVSLLVFFSVRIEDKKDARRKNFAALAVITASVCMLVLATGVVSVPVPRIAAAPEVAPSMGASLRIAAATARGGAKNFIFGSGPSTYQYEYVAHHDASLNQTLFWNVQFTQGFNGILTALVSWGIFGTILFLLFVGVIVHMAIRLARNRRMDHVTATAVALAAYASITLFLYPQNFVLQFLFFASAGIIAAISSEGKNGYGIVTMRLGVVAMFAIALALGLLYVNGRRYVAGVQFGRGIALAAETKDISKALPFLVSGSRLDPRSDAYLGVLASAYLVQANTLAAEAGTNPAADLRKQVADAISTAVAAAERATQVNPVSAANWIALAQVYEAVAPFNAGVASSVLPVYSKAASLDPVNPAIPLYIGNAHRAAEEYAAAEEAYGKALALKPDYLQAQFALGALHYQLGHFGKARDIFEKAVGISPDYANALYFLGLSYEKLGNRAGALAALERVAQLNPESAELKASIVNIRAGKPAQ